MAIGESQSFGSLIREHRLSAGLTQEELAERAGISSRSVSDLERGLNQVPHRDTVARLVAALALSAEDAARLEAVVVRQRGPSPVGQQRSRDGSATPSIDLPTGIVTFLSVEGEPGESVLIQRCVDQHRGLLVRPPDGPGTRLAVFRTASDAVAAAIDIQQTLHDERWPTQFPFQLRVAIHTGEADVRDGEYYGSAISRCTRLRSIAAGGQTLVSQAVSELVGTSLPPGATLRDFGEHHLSELAWPERIFELTRPGMPHRYSPPVPSTPLGAHYETVLHGLMNGRIVLIAGDAINLFGRALGATWQRGQLDYVPTADEVAASLARRFDYPKGGPHELSRVAQYIATMAGSGPLFDELHSIFDADYRPTPLHEFLAGLPRLLAKNGATANYPMIIASSYDDSLERAFAIAGEPFDLVSYVAEGDLGGRFLHRPPDGRARLIDKPNKYVSPSFEKRTVILKLQGTTNRTTPDQDSFVVTEDHFVDYLTCGDLSTMVPVTIAARLRRSHFLFLGYSLRDWNLRGILRNLWGEQRLRYKSWAVHLRPPDAMERGLWRDRGVDVIDVHLQDYLEGLRARLDPPTPRSE